MKTSFHGIVTGGSLHLNEPIDLADNSRVHVTIVPIEDNKHGLRSALKNLCELKAECPIDSRGEKFTREQLHERD